MSQKGHEAGGANPCRTPNDGRSQAQKHRQLLVLLERDSLPGLGVHKATSLLIMTAMCCAYRYIGDEGQRFNMPVHTSALRLFFAQIAQRSIVCKDTVASAWVKLEITGDKLRWAESSSEILRNHVLPGGF